MSFVVCLIGGPYRGKAREGPVFGGVGRFGRAFGLKATPCMFFRHYDDAAMTRNALVAGEVVNKVLRPLRDCDCNYY
ncbi:hypothetical protein KPG71_03780 [Roseovarius sp. PS-C2]|nr:hypothetical protein [Roseovarius sp. PS-C2]